MIISRAPLRISIGGGGTDLPSYFKQYGTTFSSLAINRFVYVSCNERFNDEFLLRYSVNEEIKSINKIDHPILKETLNYYKNYLNRKIGLEITSIADVHGGTGLGSSGSFGVALQSTLRKYLKLNSSKSELAEQSTFIEMTKLKRKIGLQDQYIASYGGLAKFKVSKNGEVKVSKSKISPSLRDSIVNDLQLIYLGSIRDAESILSIQDKEIKSNKKTRNKSFSDIVDLGKEMYESFAKNDLEHFASLTNEYWHFKRERQKESTPKIANFLYNDLFSKKIIGGGKIVGAGGGGFLLVILKDRIKFTKYCKKNNLKLLLFDVDKNGAKVINI